MAGAANPVTRGFLRVLYNQALTWSPKHYCTVAFAGANRLLTCREAHYRPQDRCEHCLGADRAVESVREHLIFALTGVDNFFDATDPRSKADGARLARTEARDAEWYSSFFGVTPPEIAAFVAGVREILRAAE